VKLTDDNYQNTLVRLTEGVNSLKKLGVDITDIGELLSGKTTTTTSSTTAKKCPPPKILSFTPKTAATNSTSPEILISGTSLYGGTQVFLSGISCTIISNTDTAIVVVTKQKLTGKLKVVTEYGGQDETKEDFVFIK